MQRSGSNSIDGDPDVNDEVITDEELENLTSPLRQGSNSSNVIQTAEFLADAGYGVIGDPDRGAPTAVTYRALDIQAQFNPVERSIDVQKQVGLSRNPEYAPQMLTLAAGKDAPPGVGMAPSPPMKSVEVVNKQNEMPLAPMDDSADKESKVPLLTPCYARNTSVVSESSPDDLLKGIASALSELPDAEFNIKRAYKCAGKYFWEEKLCEFMIHFFRTPAEHAHPNCILIEFQRRSGDAFAFQRLYRATVDSLKGNELVHYTGNPADQDPTNLPTQLPMLPMPLPLPDDLEDDGTLSGGPECGYLDFSRDRTLCDNLVRMCRSIYLEPRREATSVMARGSRAQNNAALLAAVPQIIGTLINLLKDCGDLQVTRNTALVLTNMFKFASEVRETALKHRMFKIMASVFKKWSGADGAQRRSKLVSCQIGEAMELLSQADGSGKSQSFMQDHSSIDHLKRIASASPIPEAVTIASRVLAIIGAR